MAGGYSIAKDDAFHVLQNARRRAVLRYLLAHDRDQFTMRELAEEVAAWEHDTTVRELTSDERQRVYIALYQSHLPKLDDHGIIEYNQNRGVVEPTLLLKVFDQYAGEGLHTAEEVLRVPAEPGSTRTGESEEWGLTNSVSNLLSE